MARIGLPDPNESDDPEVREFASKVTAPDGHVPKHFAAETNFPSVMMNIYDARLAIARDGDLGTETFLKISVAISMANECAYCTGAYAKQLSPRLGGDEAVHDYQVAVESGDLPDRERAVIGFALVALDDPHALTDGDFERLREDHGFTDRTFIELLYTVNIVSGYNRITVGCALEYDHDYPREWARPDAYAKPLLSS